VKVERFQDLLISIKFKLSAKAFSADSNGLIVYDLKMDLSLAFKLNIDKAFVIV